MVSHPSLAPTLTCTARARPPKNESLVEGPLPRSWCLTGNLQSSVPHKPSLRRRNPRSVFGHTAVASARSRSPAVRATITGCLHPARPERRRPSPYRHRHPCAAVCRLKPLSLHQSQNSRPSLLGWKRPLRTRTKVQTSSWSKPRLTPMTSTTTKATLTTQHCSLSQMMTKLKRKAWISRVAPLIVTARVLSVT